MALRINDYVNGAKPEWIAEFSFSAELKAIETQAFRTLSKELALYIDGEVPGRAFLIAGHRGAGKTTLVSAVTGRLNREILRAAVRAAESDRPELRAQPRQRPLLVKLHGPSLFLKHVDGAEAGAKTSPRQGASDGKIAQQGDEASNAGGDTAASGASPIKKQDDKMQNGKDPAKAAAAPDDPVAYALAEITVSLFRSLAAEHGRAFGFHAREVATNARKRASINNRRDGQPGTSLEQAAQLRLDLDDGPSTALLRSAYQRLGRLVPGVFWPQVVGQDLMRGGLFDQGLREIVALTTASQAFEVCVSSIEARRQQKSAFGFEHSVASKVEANLKDLGRILLGLGAGIATGAGTGSVLTGVVTGLISVFTLSFAEKRSRKTERTADFSIVRDTSKQSLARDLPWVIQRVREAGLAPIFLIDELDKVPESQSAIGVLIDRLKHLTTDYGVFCFLTDRDYYDYVLSKTEHEVFPREYTYFSHYLFVLATPADFLAYIVGILKSDTEVGLDEVAVERQKRIFALYFLHKSKMSTIGLRRALTDFTTRGQPPDFDRRFTDDRGNLLAVTLQIAINYCLETPDLKRRSEAEPRFLQVAVDALYIISRAWENEAAIVSLERPDIVSELLRRQSIEVPRDARSAEKLLVQRNAAGAQDLGLLVKTVNQCAELLIDFGVLRETVETALRKKDNEFSISYYPLDVIKPPGMAILGLLRHERDHVYRFLFDVCGTALVIDTGMPSVADAVGIYDLFYKTLNAIGLDRNTLTVAGVLPRSLDRSLDESVDRLKGAMRVSETIEEANKDLAAAADLARFLISFGNTLSLLITTAIVMTKASPNIDIGSCLAAIGRHCDLAATFETGAVLIPNKGLRDVTGLPVALDDVPHLAGFRTSVASWALKIVKVETTAARDTDSATRWSFWRDETLAFLKRTRRQRPDFHDMRDAAAERPPGSLFRFDLDTMSTLDWTRVCLSGFADIDGPASIFVSLGLFVLGFSRSIIMLATPDERHDDPAFLFAREHARTIAPEGLLVTLSDGPADAAYSTLKHDGTQGAPMLVLNSAEISEYSQGLRWLRTHEAITRTAYGIEEIDF